LINMEEHFKHVSYLITVTEDQGEEQEGQEAEIKKYFKEIMTQSVRQKTYERDMQEVKEQLASILAL